MGRCGCGRGLRMLHFGARPRPLTARVGGHPSRSRTSLDGTRLPWGNPRSGARVEDGGATGNAAATVACRARVRDKSRVKIRDPSGAAWRRRSRGCSCSVTSGACCISPWFGTRPARSMGRPRTGRLHSRHWRGTTRRPRAASRVAVAASRRAHYRHRRTLTPTIIATPFRLYGLASPLRRRSAGSSGCPSACRKSHLRIPAHHGLPSIGWLPRTLLRPYSRPIRD